MPPGPNTYQVFSERFSLLKEKVNLLPKSIPVAKKNDVVPMLFKNVPIPADPVQHFEVFNRRMDILFGESLWDKKTGRLPNITRGAYGMDMVIGYITEAMDGGFLVWDIAQIKVDRLVGEIQTILYAYKRIFYKMSITNVSELSGTLK